jgi:photosystem II stability/assembly factor-like uncharacterized protein
MFRGDPQIIYALVDNQEVRPEEEESEEGITRDMLRTMEREAFLALDVDEIEKYLRDEGFPSEYDGAKVLQMVSDETIAPVALVEYLEDADEALVDTDIVGAEVYRSDDGGLTWTRTHDDFLDSFYFTYGYYFGEIRVAASDPQKIYILGVPLLRSDDGGASFVSIGRENVHGDHQALWVNPERRGHLVNGNDGGLNVSYDDGDTWFKLNSPSVGQFYTIAVDMATPFNVYGGLQDNGVWMGPSTYSASSSWHGNGSYPYERLYGGDGMQVEIDTRTNDIVYTGSQFGYYSRIDRTSGERKSIRPRHELGERPLRFNWQSPIHLSRHNQDILYLGSNKLHRSMNRGEDFEEISGDLTRGGRKGDVPYGTLTTISESPIRFGLIYVGSDDGLVSMTPDGGTTWRDISAGLPEHMWISRIVASAHDEGTAYVTLNGYRWDHFEPYLFVTHNYGISWSRLGSDLPAEPLNVVREDPTNASVLYVGSDHGVYISFDGGQSFMGMGGGLPDAPVHDLVIHERDHALVVGTHGRSIYVGDVSHLQAMADSLMDRSLFVFTPDEIEYSDQWGEKTWAWGELSEPASEIIFTTTTEGPASVAIVAGDEFVLKEWTVEADAGLNYVDYDLSVDPDRAAEYDKNLERANRRRTETLKPVASEPTEQIGKRYLLPGSYGIRIQKDGHTAAAKLVVVQD